MWTCQSNHTIHILRITSAVHVCACILALDYTPIDVTSNDTAAEGSVRLVGGETPLEGRVEIFLLGQWGTVCDERWDHVDATVVCRELGYPRAVEAPGLAAFGAGSGPSWYESVRCAGTEHSLTDCSKNTYNFGSACQHTQDAGVVCSSECDCVQVHSTCLKLWVNYIPEKFHLHIFEPGGRTATAPKMP